ncbi:NADH-quinone oxidoreductase subunit C [Raineyella fluvialis]|uniref:NADH-quinone oxidoreductase subunit C n=1 Tax=Raineyella fluvialis TaxID=2662261 RepID=A0A5Q2F806_9ACTN|nr:NADH-quinone oxidoreductase subunit C [Raineyella fluvialis]QGF22798.1 NADH-quinone oxidoreductase subunit C [Raineyella fluvialis]
MSEENVPALPEDRQGPGEAREVLDVRQGLFHASTTSDVSGYNDMTWYVEMPQGSRPPYGGWYDDAVERLRAGVADPAAAIRKVLIDRGEITLFIAREHIAEVARVLRDDPMLRFEWCSSVSGVHYPTDRGAELHAVYHLLSMTHNRRIRLEVSCPDADPHIPSVVATYPTADWHERETYDFFGIVFDGHPALTRIEMPDDWPGHPQRKDYPLGGIPIEFHGATNSPVHERRDYNS